MSQLLYRLGRFAARRPWVVIASWLVVSVVVIGASGTFGRELEDSFQAPGVDSHKATELLSAAGSDQAGLTAQVVLTPRADGATFFDSPRGAGGPGHGPGRGRRAAERPAHAAIRSPRSRPGARRRWRAGRCRRTAASR